MFRFYCVLIIFLLLTCFQVISLEGWVDIMYMVQDAHSFWDWFYFVSLIVVSNLLSYFFLLTDNLILFPLPLSI